MGVFTMRDQDFDDGLITLQSGDHVACICDSAEERIELLSCYLYQGLERGEKVRYLADKPNPEVVMDALRLKDTVFESRLLSGQLSFAPIEEVLGQTDIDLTDLFNWLEVEERLATSQGYSALRVTMEMGWVLGGRVRAAELLDFEVKLHSFLKNRKSLVLCQYERKRFSPTLLLYVMAVHPKIIHEKKAHDNCFFLVSPHLLERDFPTPTLRRWLKELSSRKAAPPAENCVHTS
jgi:hypothetical protein